MHWKFCASSLVIFALGSSAAIAAPTVRFKILHEFHETDGIASIVGPLVKGIDGRLYGVLGDGGQYDQGVLFSITRQGDFRLLYSFTGGLDGAQPNTLFRDPQGHLYGATAFGGLDPDHGVLFSVGADGTPTVVHNFTGIDGGQISGSIVQFKEGSFYGTTGTGGEIGSGGTIYRFTPPSTVAKLYEFGAIGELDQSAPYYGLSQADGVFYGTTSVDFPEFPHQPLHGTVFRVTDSGELTTLYSFTGGADGRVPVGPPVPMADGNFYGVTSGGGEFGCGTIYRVDANGAFTLVHAFTGDPEAADGGGCIPLAGLVKGKDGRLYGSTSGGGNEFGLGLIFRLSVSGELEVLHRFQNMNRACCVAIPLVEGRAGTFFGITSSSGLRNTGTIFKLVVREND